MWLWRGGCWCLGDASGHGVSPVRIGGFPVCPEALLLLRAGYGVRTTAVGQGGVLGAAGWADPGPGGPLGSELSGCIVGQRARVCACHCQVGALRQECWFVACGLAM